METNEGLEFTYSCPKVSWCATPDPCWDKGQSKGRVHWSTVNKVTNLVGEIGCHTFKWPYLLREVLLQELIYSIKGHIREDIF